jgi:hypothetical protein
MSALRKAAFVLLALLIALAVLLWRLPVSSALLVIPSPSNAPWSKFLSLHEVNGTLWRGSARFSVSAVPVAQLLQWRCAPSVASFAIDCDLGGALSGRIVLRPLARGVQAERLSSDIALQFAANPSVVAASERVALTIARLDANDSRVSLEGGIVARDTSYRIGDKTFDLGEVFIDCKPVTDKAESACAIKNRASATRLDGVLTLSARRASGSIEINEHGMNPQKMSF